MSSPEVGAVVALKRSEHAKSRLRPLPDDVRRRLAWAMAVDTLAALGRTVDLVVVVGDEPGLAERLAGAGLGATVLGEPERPGMNAALAAGAEHLRRAGAAVVVAAVADLPALRPESVAAVLAASAPHARSFVADTTGLGTTLLLARGADLAPQFQGRSAAAHRHSGAVALDGAFPHARRDVDTEVDLADAVRLGVGPATRRVVEEAGLARGPASTSAGR